MAQMIWDSLGPLFIMFIGIVISQMVRNGQGVRRVWTVLDTLPDQMRAAWNGTDARLQGLRPDTQPPPCSMPINPDARLRFHGEEDGVDLQERFILGRDRRFQSDGASAPFICWPVQGAPYVVAVCADSYEDGIAWWQDCIAAAAAFSALSEAEVFLFDPGATPQAVRAELRMQTGQSHDAIVALLEQIRLEISMRPALLGGRHGRWPQAPAPMGDVCAKLMRLGFWRCAQWSLCRPHGPLVLWRGFVPCRSALRGVTLRCRVWTGGLGPAGGPSQAPRLHQALPKARRMRHRAPGRRQKQTTAQAAKAG